jgi:hypothetical protein
MQCSCCRGCLLLKAWLIGSRSLQECARRDPHGVQHLRYQSFGLDRFVELAVFSCIASSSSLRGSGCLMVTFTVLFLGSGPSSRSATVPTPMRASAAGQPVSSAVIGCAAEVAVLCLGAPAIDHRRGHAQGRPGVNRPPGRATAATARIIAGISRNMISAISRRHGILTVVIRTTIRSRIIQTACDHRHRSVHANPTRRRFRFDAN